MITQSLLAVLGLAAITNGHVIMNTPVPYGKSTLNNSPLAADGSDFPCKQRAGVYAEGSPTSMALGSTQPLSFTGSAVHGGGSCQISVTYDKEPTKNSVFKVIHSIVGGCPMQGVEGNTGNDADQPAGTFSFKIPDSLPTGDATLAWTWFNKIGNREMYMNCAPITITGGSSKRDNDFEVRNVTQFIERDISAYNALPNMFIANIPEAQCRVPDGKDLRIPAANLGDSVEYLGAATSAAALADPTGPACAAAATPIATVPAGGSATASSSAQISATSAAASAPVASSLTGGVFVTVPTPTLAKSTSAAIASTASASASPAKSAAPAPSAGSGGALTGACATDGAWNCVGGTSFQQCASGTWSVVQPLAAGTKCVAGQSNQIDITAIKEKREPEPAARFLNPHVRRQT